MAMSLMAVSSVNVALHTIETGLGASSADLQWILSGYALAFGVGLIPAGRAGDVLGRGTLFVVGAAVFTVASLACGLAPTPLILNAARIAQGVGAALFSPQVTGMIQQYFSGGGRAKAFALLGLVVSASVAVGPIIAGAVIEAVGPETGWRWAFFSYLPIGLAAVVLGLLWFPFETERRRRIDPELRAKRVDLDPVGSVLIVLIVLAIMYPFMAHAAWAWWLLLAAPPLVLAWIRWERGYVMRGREPLVDLGLFQYRSFRNGLLVSGAVFLGMTSTFAVVALFLQSGQGVDALSTGLIGLPNAIASGVVAIVTAKYVLGRGRQMLVGAISSMLAGTLLSILVVWLIATQGISFWWLSPVLMLNGLGMGIVGSANQTLSMLDIPRQHGGTAGGFKQTVERITTALGNAVITGIFFAVVASNSWATGFMAAFTGIAVCLVAAIGLAVMDLRQHSR
ncbi:MAG: MFS transporter [Propionibacterium sp.]|nr:MFS transporter [Propionibacterium sp.]